MPSDLEDDSGDENDSRSLDGDEGSASEEEDLGTDDESEDDDDVPEFQIDTELDNGEGTRNGHHENDDEDNGEVEVDYEEGYEEDGPNAPSIFVPPNVVDIPSRPRARASSSASASSSGSSGSEDDGRAVNKNKNKSKSKGKATSKPKGKQPLWLDPADQLISVDLENDKRLRKLARGVNGSTVKGKELEKRLRQQYESIHPRPDWADQRSHAGVASLSSLLSSTKSFIDDGRMGRGTNGKGKGKNNGGSGGGGYKPRSALAPGELDIQRLRNANQQNPTAGKRDAVDAGDGVVDLAWHPSERVGVLAVAGGDRRVRFFNVGQVLPLHHSRYLNFAHTSIAIAM
jgi:U3 small nucleolar RNA-associated protein 18